MGRLGLNKADGEDAVQEAFERIVVAWASFSPTPELPERSARRRWIAGHLLSEGRRIRRARRRAEARELPADREGHVSIAASPEAHVSARETLRTLQCCTSPDRWRVWIAHEVDGVPVAEIARQEGRPRATIYNLLRLARRDFAAAIARDALADRNPGPRRGRRRA